MRVLTEFDPRTISALLASGESLWLDLVSTSVLPPDGLERALGIEDIHEEPLGLPGGAGALDMAAREAHMEVSLLVVGVGGDPARQLPILTLLGERFLVTIHDPLVGITASSRPLRSPAAAFARVIGTVTQSYPPVITMLDEEIERAQELALEADPTALARMQDLRARVLRLRRALVAQRDAVGRAMDELLEEDPPSSEIRALRNGYERFVRLADSLESSRELIFAATDLYLSAASNRLGRLAERLTVFASIFLPATVVVGFFGQNFDWMTTRIDSFGAFVGFGLGGLLGAMLIAVLFLRRQGYLGES